MLDQRLVGSVLAEFGRKQLEEAIKLLGASPQGLNVDAKKRLESELVGASQYVERGIDLTMATILGESLSSSNKFLVQSATTQYDSMLLTLEFSALVALGHNPQLTAEQFGVLTNIDPYTADAIFYSLTARGLYERELAVSKY